MDQYLLHLINERWTSPALDLFMAAISNPDIWKPFIAVLVVAVLIFGGFRGRAFLVVVLLALLVCSQFTVGILKNAIGRKRPKQVQPVRMVQLANTRPEFLTLFHRPVIRYANAEDATKSGPSFPSGHTTNNVVIATVMSLFFRRWGWLYFLVAAAIGYSRIYLGAHWPSDVIGTVFMAFGETLLVLALLEFLWRNAAGRWAPEVFARHPRLLEARAT